jgi:hypothetical protein
LGNNDETALALLDHLRLQTVLLLLSSSSDSSASGLMSEAKQSCLSSILEILPSSKTSWVQELRIGNEINASSRGEGGNNKGDKSEANPSRCTVDMFN